MCIQIPGLFEVFTDKIMLGHGDCLELMRDIPDESIDCCITDPPYGTTNCKWDNVIDFDLMWAELKRIVKPNGAICLFGSEPFSSALRMSNIKMFKYDWIWEKSVNTGFVNAKLMPIKSIEVISVFSQYFTANPSKKKMAYYPQGLTIINKQQDQRKKRNKHDNERKYAGKWDRPYVQKFGKYPRQILKYGNHFKNGYVPTQKPVALLEYLIKTYTLENETVLDFTAGSGSTGVAAKNLKRKFIGIEKEEKYYEIAKQRLEL